MVCCFILIISAFLVSYVLGGMTAELQKISEKLKGIQKKMEYVTNSLDIHKFPKDLEVKFNAF